MITDKDPIKIELTLSNLKEHIRVLLDLSFLSFNWNNDSQKINEFLFAFLFACFLYIKYGKKTTNYYHFRLIENKLIDFVYIIKSS